MRRSRTACQDANNSAGTAAHHIAGFPEPQIPTTIPGAGPGSFQKYQTGRRRSGHVYHFEEYG